MKPAPHRYRVTAEKDVSLPAADKPLETPHTAPAASPAILEGPGLAAAGLIAEAAHPVSYKGSTGSGTEATLAMNHAVASNGGHGAVRTVLAA